VDERSEVNILAPRARTTHRTEVTEGSGGGGRKLGSERLGATCQSHA
jgi:hypothetical protein